MPYKANTKKYLLKYKSTEFLSLNFQLQDAGLRIMNMLWLEAERKFMSAWYFQSSIFTVEVRSQLYCKVES